MIFKEWFLNIKKIKQLEKQVELYRDQYYKESYNTNHIRKFYSDLTETQTKEIIELKDLIEAKNLIIQKLMEERK